MNELLLFIIIIMIIIKQLVTQDFSVKNELTNRSCGLATAVSDGKICQRDVFYTCCKEKRQDMRGHQLNGVADYDRRSIAESPTGERRPMVIEVETILPVTRA